MAGTRRGGLTMGAVVYLALAGCGFQIAAGSGDARHDGDADPDDAEAADDAGRDGMVPDVPPQSCLDRWLGQTIQFAPAVALGVNSTSSDRDPFVSDDELTIWFASGRAPSQSTDIWTATRADRGNAFGTPTLASAFNSPDGENKLSITGDGLYAVVASLRVGGEGGTDLWHTSRATTAQPWPPLVRTHTMTVNTPDSEEDPALARGGLDLYYAPQVPAPQRIMLAKRTTITSSFSAGVPVASLFSDAGDGDPTLFSAGRIIVFYSARAATQAGTNVWYATRANDGLAFAPPVELTSVNTPQDEGDVHVSEDGCRIYFARRAMTGEYDLLSATATP